MTLEESKNSPSQQLFNQIKKPIITGEHHPDSQTIKDALAEGSLVAIFCHGCGYTQGVDQDGLNFIIQNTDLELLEDWSNKFISVNRCNLCDECLDNLKIESM